MKEKLYNYKARLIEVIDGDTIDIDIDLGFDISIKQRVRLYNVDTPEVRTRNLLEKEAGLKVKNILIEKLMNNEVYVKTIKLNDKFGRYLADVFIKEHDNLISISEFLINGRYAKLFDGTCAREEWTKDELDFILNN